MMKQKHDYATEKMQLNNVADWNGAQAVRAYLDGDMDEYARLISQADRLWAKAARIRVS